MTDSENSTAPVAKRQAPQKQSSEPPPSPASATPRGPTMWTWLRGLMALRTPSLRDDLEVALESEQNGETTDFTQSERAILKNVLELGEKHVEDVMVPRADVEAIETDDTLGELIAKFRQAGHSRIPVYDGDLDNVTGFIHVKDALRKITEPTEPGATQPVKLVSASMRQKIGKLGIAREVLFVPPLMPVGDLLTQMQLKRVHMAVVIDEYGGTDGLVTIEDLLEAVVGEIEDEHDDDVALIRRVNGSTYVASARAELDDVKQVIGPDFDPGEFAEEVDTIGGLVFDLAGHVPAKGEIVQGLNGIKGFEFEVLLADSRQVKRVKIKRIKARTPRSKGPASAAAPDGQAAGENAAE